MAAAEHQAAGHRHPLDRVAVELEDAEVRALGADAAGLPFDAFAFNGLGDRPARHVGPVGRTAAARTGEHQSTMPQGRASPR